MSMNDEIWAGKFGPQWDALKNSYEENVQILGRDFADQIERAKSMPPGDGRVYAVTKVNLEKRSITIGPVKGVSQ